MKAYKVSGWTYKVSEVEVERFTEKQVVLLEPNRFGRRPAREARISEYGSYFETIEEAQDWSIARLRAGLQRVNKQIEVLEEKRGFLVEALNKAEVNRPKT